TFHFHTGAHSHAEKTIDNHNDFKGHLLRNTFLGSDYSGNTINQDESSFYSNYYIGNDQSKWKSFVRSYHKTQLPNFYPGVKMEYAGENGALKYSFIVQPNVDPSIIKSQIEGAEKIKIDKNGDLNIYHSLGIITENKPVAWQIINDEKKTVNVAFKLNDSILSYSIGNYDPNYELIIDPNLTFSTFSGSTADNWGSTATPDDLGNVFAGGIVFGQGLPTTTGAYDQTFNGTSVFNQNFDVGIMKFTSDGASLLFSTYLGGATSNEFPSSMVCGANGELYVLGMTGSSDFPTVNAYDPTFNGGISFVPQSGSAPIPGSDVFITRFNPNGTAILSSTFVGGSGNDGYNGSTTLKYNYGDEYRGEITLDSIYNVYVATSTTSSNFPLVGSGGQTMQGLQSAVAFKMNSTLSSLLWSRYISGTGADAGYSIQVAYNGNVFVAGGTTSSNLSLVSGEDLTFNGGISDGFLIKLNPLTGQTINGTYIGQNEYDQVYLVQTDVQNDPYVVGQSESSFAITPGKYGNANSGQFIRKYTNNLSAIQWTTMIGASSGHVELSPTAFLVSDCGDIYLAGWGGPLNVLLSQATNSTVTGFPVTSDAYQATTLGDNFYLAVLGTNASTLKYATFFGGLSNSNKHVDGGTSRFDKHGRVYHAVCAACGGNSSGFTSTTGAWSTTNNSSNCNLAAFKFDLSVIVPLITVLDPLICYPEPVFFQNNTINADNFYWTFGDGTSSTVQSPSHVYPGAGSYTVTLVAWDALGCYQADTSSFVIDVGDFQGGLVQPTDTICIGGTYQLHATGGQTYQWTPGQFLDDSTSSDPFATIDTTTVFTVIISDSCGADTLSCTLNVFNEILTASNDTNICIGNDVPLFASGAANYSWSPSTFLNDPNIANPISSPTQTINYVVTGTTANGCVYTENVEITVFTNPPAPVMDDTIRICVYSTQSTTVSGGVSYMWYPNTNITPNTGPTVSLSPIQDMYYYCDFTNSCGTVTDSIFADVLFPSIQSFGDTTICPGDAAVIGATGAVNYIWSPAGTLSSSSGNPVSARPLLNTNYQVVGIDADGCLDTAFVNVMVYPKPIVSVPTNYLAFFGEPVEITATSNVPGTFTWSPSDHLSCTVCATTYAEPNQEFLYTVSFVDQNGCLASSGVKLTYDPIVYIPNTFTPDQDEFNQVFYVVHSNIKSFKMYIYDRWGEQIHEMREYANFWDGTFSNNKVCPDGVYSWKLIYYDFYEKPHVMTGHVNLVR
ncbi:MAG: gliding motility-associated C-terminal domain-containing protein, partial [Bacteroidota bacterium]